HARPLDVRSFPTRRSSDLECRDERSQDQGRVEGQRPCGQTVVWLKWGAGQRTGKAQGAARRAGRVHARRVTCLPALLMWMSLRIDRKSTRLNSSHVKISYA